MFTIESAIEYSLGVDQTIKLPFPMQYRGVATFGLGLDLEASVTVPLPSVFSVGVGCEYYHFSSLQEQRSITGNILDIDRTSIIINENSTSTNIFGFVSYRY